MKVLTLINHLLLPALNRLAFHVGAAATPPLFPNDIASTSISIQNIR
jgi:hypothetical protein